MSTVQEEFERLLARDFGTYPDLIRFHAEHRANHCAMIHHDQRLSYAQYDALLDRIAASLQRDGINNGDTIAICALNSIPYAALFLAALRIGVGVAPLAPSSTAASLANMVRDSDAKALFLDQPSATALASHTEVRSLPWITLDGSSAGTPFTQWLAAAGAKPAPVTIDPEGIFNIIYSSGTTGTPKGIVQSHRMRWFGIKRARAFGMLDVDANTDSVSIVSTPLYSNTTLAAFFPAVAGRTIVIMEKFDALKFLDLCATHRVTHAMLVPVQYHRLLAHPKFDTYDLSRFRMKFCTSAPFTAAMKAEVLRRWPGGLVDFYGMTEGGPGCALAAHEHPDKLHTVGKPAPSCIVRLIDESGEDVPPGEVGEIVGRSAGMMNGYHKLPLKTAEAFWQDKDGNRYIRTGDMARFDQDGFVILMDRKKDMIITGGFNVYPSDLEAILAQHDAVLESAVVGVASEQWGETPVAFVVVRPQAASTATDIMTWVNERVGKTQRLSAVELRTSLPRSAIGKVLKRELRDEYNNKPPASSG